jgi:hypothetical protein
MKTTDRQIHLSLHFMQMCAEQQVAVFSSAATCGHTARHAQHTTTNVILFLPYFWSDPGVVHEGDYALRTIRRHTHRDWETVREFWEENCFVWVRSNLMTLSLISNSFPDNPVTAVLNYICVCVCVCVGGGGGLVGGCARACLCMCVSIYVYMRTLMYICVYAFTYVRACVLENNELNGRHHRFPSATK